MHFYRLGTTITDSLHPTLNRRPSKGRNNTSPIQDRFMHISPMRILTGKGKKSSIYVNNKQCYPPTALTVITGQYVVEREGIVSQTVPMSVLHTEWRRLFIRSGLLSRCVGVLIESLIQDKSVKRRKIGTTRCI